MAQVPYNKVKVKSAYKPSGPPDQGLSRFL